METQNLLFVYYSNKEFKLFSFTVTFDNLGFSVSKKLDLSMQDDYELIDWVLNLDRLSIICLMSPNLTGNNAVLFI